MTGLGVKTLTTCVSIALYPEKMLENAVNADGKRLVDDFSGAEHTFS